MGNNLDHLVNAYINCRLVEEVEKYHGCKKVWRISQLEHQIAENEKIMLQSLDECECDAIFKETEQLKTELVLLKSTI